MHGPRAIRPRHSGANRGAGLRHRDPHRPGARQPRPPPVRRDMIEQDMAEQDMTEQDMHLIPLPGTEWTVWRDAVLRSAGFPAAGLDRFAAPECAAVADAFLDGRASEQELESAHGAALADASKCAADIAADPLFREAVTWQNPAMVPALASVHEGAATAEAGKQSSRRRGKRRSREDTIARYWQRYCGKNDTIGFFGPVTWARLDPQGPAVRVRCGDALVRSRETFYEFWALATYAECLAADPVVRPWLPVGMHPDLTLDGRRLLRPGLPPLELSAAQTDLLSRCDGRTPAAAIAAPPRQAEELALLEDLAALDAARAAVSAAAGHPDRLAAAIGRLDAEFTAVTGAKPEHSQGKMYAGRRLCYEETVRDIDVSFGQPLLDALAGPLGRVLLPAA